MADLQKAPFLVYDVGGSHVSAAISLGSDYSLGPVVRAHHPAEQSSEAFIGFLHSLGMEAAAGYDAPAGATLAIPSPFNFEDGISLMRHKLPFLYGVNLRQGLARLFGWTPCAVNFLNDADAYLLGEIGAGAAQGCARAIGITLGTGTGSAFAVEGHLVTEGAGVPRGGEIWNLPFAGGVVEDFLSSRAISCSYKKRTGMERDASEVAAVASQDPAAFETFQEFGVHLGEVIGRILAGFAPEVIVLGGGISRASSLFLPAAWSQLTDSTIRLRVSELQDCAPLAGCAVARLKGGVAAQRQE